MGLFLLSVAGSVMIRFGSMDATFGTINAGGQFVGKESYSLAEYGVTLLSSFLTTATGILAFAFSLDDNAETVAAREDKRRELRALRQTMEPLRRELAVLELTADPAIRDEQRRRAAEDQLEALHTGLKLHVRQRLTTYVSDPDFTQRMSGSADALIRPDVSLFPVPLDRVS